MRLSIALLLVSLSAAQLATGAVEAPADGGEQVWLARGPSASSGIGVAASPDGNRIFVLRRSEKSLTTVAYAARTGRQLWEASIDAPGTGESGSIDVAPDGATVYVAGTTVDAGGASYVTVAYRAGDGRERWTAAHRGLESSFAAGAAISADGKRVYVTGSAVKVREQIRYETVAYDAANGERRWVSVYEGPGRWDEAKDIAVSPTGERLYVTGTSAAKDKGRGYAIVALRTVDGRQLWAVRNSSPSFAALGVSPDGSRVYVTGSGSRRLQGTQATTDIVTIAYRGSTGARVWVTRTRGPVLRSQYGPLHAGTGGAAIVVAPNGNRLFAAGNIDRWTIGANGAQASNDFLTVAYGSATGRQLWVARYNNPHDDYDVANAVAVSPDGRRAYVTGGSAAYATVAYATATGKRLWVARYADPARGWNGPSAIAVAPDGSRVYVSGSVTIAYRAK